MEKGIKELKELVVFIASLSSASDKAMRDGLGLSDMALFMAPLMMAPEALAGLDEAKLEYADLSEAEKAELNAAFAKELDLVDDGLEALIEKSMMIGLELFRLIKQVKALKDA